MFELTAALLRVLECVTIDAPLQFLNSDVNLTRLCESLLFALHRTTEGPDAKNFRETIEQHGNSPRQRLTDRSARRRRRSERQKHKMEKGRPDSVNK